MVNLHDGYNMTILGLRLEMADWAHQQATRAKVFWLQQHNQHGQSLETVNLSAFCSWGLCVKMNRLSTYTLLLKDKDRSSPQGSEVEDGREHHW